MSKITSFSGEHRWLAAKTFDQSQRLTIQGLMKPEDAKRFGRRITLRPDWETVKLSVMLSLLRSKFAEKSLADKLKATGDSVLVEGNHWNDTFWGVCNGIGENHLGKLLMQVRKKLR